MDVVLVAARIDDAVVSTLVDAREAPTLQVEHLRLVGANASGTVTLRFHDHLVPAERVVGYAMRTCSRAMRRACV